MGLGELVFSGHRTLTDGMGGEGKKKMVMCVYRFTLCLSLRDALQRTRDMSHSQQGPKETMFYRCSSRGPSGLIKCDVFHTPGDETIR